MIRWQSIESAPQDEAGSFLVFTLCAGKEPVVVQVSRFEGRLYPDFLGAAIDWADAVTRATHWMPLPLMPSEQVTGVDATIRSEPPISSPAGALTAEKADVDGLREVIRVQKETIDRLNICNDQLASDRDADREPLLRAEWVRGYLAYYDSIRAVGKAVVPHPIIATIEELRALQKATSGDPRGDSALPPPLPNASEGVDPSPTATGKAESQ